MEIKSWLDNICSIHLFLSIYNHCSTNLLINFHKFDKKILKVCYSKISNEKTDSLYFY